MKQKKELDFDLNIISFIGLLAVCICFLLLTVIWIHVVSLDVKQYIGDDSVKVQQDQGQTQETKILIQMQKDRQVVFLLQNPPLNIDTKLHSHSIKGINKNGVLYLNYKAILSYLEMLTNQIPEVSAGILVPYADARYEDIIHLMDQLKEAGIHSLGISPL